MEPVQWIIEGAAIGAFTGSGLWQWIISKLFKL